ncbi:zinc finger domain-containing protein [Actinacidiphila oryziradicis]
MSTCAAPAGSPCRTGKGKVAIQYHTARFRLVPQLAKALNVPTPAVPQPRSVWTELPRPVNAGAEPAGHVRLGYCRASTARQSLRARASIDHPPATNRHGEAVAGRFGLIPALDRPRLQISQDRSGHRLASVPPSRPLPEADGEIDADVRRRGH